MNRGVILKRFFKILFLTFLIYIIYFLFTVIIFPKYYPPKINNYYDDDLNFYGENVSHNEKIALIDNSKALSARINLLESAKETIYLSQFYINDDFVGKIFLGEILQAANRGVKVKIIIDGKYNKISGLIKDYLYALIIHPNIEVKLYEPFKVLKPWTINNFLHDKILIIDNKYGMISGRNIGNRYFLEDVNNNVYDLDTIIINTSSDKSDSLREMQDYFFYMWNHKYCVKTKKINKNKISKGRKKQQLLIYNLENTRKINKELFEVNFDWEELSVPVNKITLVYNPLERFNKTPLVWLAIANLINNAKNNVFINSPYIVPTKEIANKLETNKLSAVEINVLTNSAGSTPNILAFSGYLRYKEKLLKSDNINIFEYQGKGSLHSKAYIIDDQLSVVGSYNLDPRSTFLSTESILVVDSTEFAKLLNDYFNNKIDKSLLTNGLYSYENDNVEPLPVSTKKKIVLSIMRYVAYLIDHLV